MAVSLTTDYTRYFAFKYMWYINATDIHWTGANVRESLRYRHSSNDPATFLDNTVKARYANLHSFCCSVWSSSAEDDAFQSNSAFTAYLDWLMSEDNPVPDFTAFMLYELEAGVDPPDTGRDPTAAQIYAMLEAHRFQFTKWSYSKHRAIHKTRSQALGSLVYVDNAPMVYVYQTGGATRAQAWLDAVELYEAAHMGETIYLILDLWTNWTTNFANLLYIDALCKYQPAGDGVYEHHEAATSYKLSSITVTPGFHNPPAAPLLTRSLSGFQAALDLTNAYQAVYGLSGLALDLVAVATWDEFPEDSGVVEASGFPTAGIYPNDAYLVAMRDRFPTIR